MPDISGLYPQAPQASALNSGPMGALHAIAPLIGAVRASRQLQAEQAKGEALQRNTRPDGTYDFEGAAKDLKNDPRAAAYGMANTVSGLLDMHGKQIQNDTAQFAQGAIQNNYAMDWIARRASQDMVSPEELYGDAAGLVRNGVHPRIVNSLINGILTDPQGPTVAVKNVQNRVMGAANAAQRIVAPPSEAGAPQTMPLGAAGYPQQGGAVAPGGPHGAMPIGLPPGRAEAMSAQATSGQAGATALQASANEVPNYHTQLDLMANDLKQASSKFGPTAAYEKSANVIANRVIGIMPTMTREQVASLESFDKVARQIALSQTSALHATDQTLTTSLGANPNTHLSAYGNEGIINMLHGNADAIAAKNREWNKALRLGRVTPDQFFQWSDDFNQRFDPRVFQFMRMNKEQQATLLSNTQDKDAFEAHIVDAARRGWIKIPK